ncbi:MAG: Asp23/Gls24 family envelope stress response protein [Clostridia bacterium]|nr:Asp23/Gls24 family envelope stress response protein [Clostridia bacterium]
MDKETQVITDVQVNETGKVVFAPDVVATIANIAATQVEGVSDLGGGFADSISGIFGGKKNYTKGVRVEVGSEEAAVDLSINVKYGCKIQDVSNAVQEAVKNQIESMTGLRVVEVNVYVQSVTFEQEKVEKPEKKKPEEAPRVR